MVKEDQTTNNSHSDRLESPTVLKDYVRVTSVSPLSSVSEQSSDITENV